MTPIEHQILTTVVHAAIRRTLDRFDAALEPHVAARAAVFSRSVRTPDVRFPATTATWLSGAGNVHDEAGGQGHAEAQFR